MPGKRQAAFLVEYRFRRAAYDPGIAQGHEPLTLVQVVDDDPLHDADLRGREPDSGRPVHGVGHACAERLERGLVEHADLVGALLQGGIRVSEYFVHGSGRLFRAYAIWLACAIEAATRLPESF